LVDAALISKTIREFVVAAGGRFYLGFGLQSL